MDRENRHEIHTSRNSGTVKAARGGKRLRQSTLEELEKALRSGLPLKKTRTRSAEIRFTLDDPE
jgi:hypothetical protein